MRPLAKHYDAVISIPFARLGIRLEQSTLKAVDFVSGTLPLKAPTDKLGRDVCEQLRAYFSNPRHRFRLPLRLDGTDFQKRVWRALRAIPTGKVVSYGQLAQRLNTGPRAIGNACRANPIPIIVPCHRVIAAGSGGGYMGRTAGTALRFKHWLLHHEHA